MNKETEGCKIFDKDESTVISGILTPCNRCGSMILKDKCININNYCVCKKCFTKFEKESLRNEAKFFGIKKVEDGMKLMLEGLRDEFGLDINNENFRLTPKRVARAYAEIFEGINAEEEIKNIADTSFPSEYHGMVMEKNIKVFSMCPHHFLPVEYVVNVAYIPNIKTVGISKLARVAEILAKQPELQEMFTEKLCNLLNKELEATGVMVQVKGRHMCMAMRGIKKDAWTITASVSGAFKYDQATREEFLSYLNSPQNQ